MVVSFLALISYHKKLSYRFSSDPETSMGLVQHEGGPCGVLAAIQVMPWLLNINMYFCLMLCVF